jgi:hypothetical protein
MLGTFQPCYPLHGSNDEDTTMSALKFGETITDLELKARAERFDPQKIINAMMIVMSAKGYYVKVWIEGHLYYMTTYRSRSEPRYWRRLPSLIDHITKIHPYIKKISLNLEEKVVHKPKGSKTARLAPALKISKPRKQELKQGLIKA